MKNLKLKFLACALAAGVQLAPAQNPVSGFQEFRKGLLDNFQEFKARILEHYADFLEGEWHAYEPLEALTRGEKPKPDTIPSVEGQTPVKEGELAAPNVNKTRMKRVAASKALKKNTNAIFNPSAKGVNVVVRNLPENVRSDSRSSLAAKTDAVAADSTVAADSPALQAVEIDDSEATIPPSFDFMPASAPKEGMDPVDFYGMELLVPTIDFTIFESIPSTDFFGRQWRNLDSQNVASQAQAGIKPVIDGLGLSDYLAYEFLLDYAESKFPKADARARASLVHYLLANMGYDVRLGTVTTGEPLVMLNSAQTIYQVPRVELDGVMYYIFAPSGGNISSGILTCTLPEAASGLGRQFDFMISGLNLPEHPRRYDLNLGKIHISGTVNRNIFPVLYRYPQMDTGDYAASDVLPDVKADVARQVREQLAGMPPQEAVNELLHFVQNSFAYATDSELHGFEKPYFFEENLYYPTNDCEDRAIFYTYLLWNALDIENHLLQYPQHESASVCLPSDIMGVGYMFNGKRFFISDPTYIGATTGQCMPTYLNTTPTIDYVYPLD